MSDKHHVTVDDAFGDGFVLQFEGRVVQFAPRDNVEVVGRFQKYMEEQAWAALERAARVLSPQQLMDQADGIRRDIVAGVYAHGSRYWAEAQKCMVHQKRLLVEMARYHDKDFDPVVIDRIFTNTSKLAELLGKAYGVDPNALIPAASQGPG